MNRMNAGSVAAQAHQGFTLAALTLVVGISGRTQASRWMSRNDTDRSDVMTTVAVEHEEFASREFQQLTENEDFEQSKSIPTGFCEPVPTADSATSPAQAQVPPATPKHGTSRPSIHETFTAHSGQTTHQLTKLSAPRKTLIMLGAAETLDEKIRNAPGMVLVDFYADWCGPCRRQGTILHDLEAQADKNNATIIKVNIDRHPQLTQQYHVTSLPTLIAMKDGNVVTRQVGLASSTKVASLLRM